MATAPNLVVAGDTGIARKLRETGRFPAVFEVASARELRALSRSGQVRAPAVFMFAPGFIEDLSHAGVAVLANGLADNGFTVVVHSFFAERGDVFDPSVRVTGRHLRLSELLTTLGAAEPNRENTSQPASAVLSKPASGSAGRAGGAPRPAHPAAPGGAPAPDGRGLPPAVPAAGPADPPPAGNGRWNGGPGQSPAPWPGAAPVPNGRVGHPSAVPNGGVGHPSAPAPDGRMGRLPAPVPMPTGAWASTPAMNGLASRPGEADRTAEAAPPATGRRGRVVAVASAKGGVGKTSIVVNLATHAAKFLQSVGRAGSVVLVDTNFQQADVARYLDLRTPTILELLRTPAIPSAASLRDHLAHVPGIDLYALLGPPDATSADPALINAVPYRRIFSALREAFDFIFVDTPVAELYHATFTDLILPEADAILVPVEPNRVTLDTAGLWLRAITMPQYSPSGGVLPEKLSLVLNRARLDVDCSPEQVMDLMPGWRFVGMIPELQEWTHAVNNHRFAGMRGDPALDATLHAILRAVTADPVFSTTARTPSVRASTNLRKRLFAGLKSR